MKIINRTEFLALEPGVVFTKYSEYGSFGELCVRGASYDNYPGDFEYQSFIEVRSGNSYELVDKLYKAETSGDSFSLNFNRYNRDGLYDVNQKFAIFEKEDLLGLINLLSSLPMVKDSHKG
jgi:hypothetical protein